jgi:HEPN domain-containing protein
VAVISYLEYSKRDLKYAHDMFSLGNYDPCGRFCQQSIEKKLKHYIEKNGTAENMLMLHTHNLVKLYNAVCELSKTKPDRATRGDLYQLTVYYFDTNYPSEENIELTREMAKEAVEIAERINDWVDLLKDNP